MILVFTNAPQHVTSPHLTAQAKVSFQRLSFGLDEAAT